MARICAAAVLALLFCSCATTSVPYRELAARDAQLADSVLLALGVTIETRDERLATERHPFANPYPALHLLLEDGADYRTLDIPLEMDPDDWVVSGDRYRYTNQVLAVVPPGAYLLRVLELHFTTTKGSNLQTGYYLLLYPRVGFTVSGPGAYALGTLRLYIDDIAGESLDDLKISSRLWVDQGDEAIAANAAAVAERAPSLAADPQLLAAHFAYSLVTPQLYDDILDRREDALWLNASSDRIEAGFEGSTFFLNKKVSDDTFDYLRPASIQPLPANYDIEWDGRLMNGEPEKRFGLMLGEDERNCLVVTVSGSGTASVLAVADGAWQKSLLGPVPSAARTLPSGESNRYLVSVRGSHVRLSVDGSPLGEFTSPFALTRGFLAPLLESRGVLTITRLRITGVP